MSFPGLKDQQLKVARAWAMKELFSKFWEYQRGGLGATIFQGLVWLGKPQPTQTDGRRGPPAQAASGKPADLSAPSHYQRRDGGVELKNPEHQIGGPGLPQL